MFKLNRLRWMSLCILFFVFGTFAIAAPNKDLDRCEHLWPNAWYRLSRGVDLSKLDFQPTRETYHRNNGVREPVFRLTCFENHLFHLANQLRSDVWPSNLIENHTIVDANLSATPLLVYSLPDELELKWQHHIQPQIFNKISASNIDNSSSPVASLQPDQRTFDEDEYAYARQQLIRLDLVGERWQDSWWAENGFGDAQDFTGAFKVSKYFSRLRSLRMANARISHEARIPVKAYRFQIPKLHRLSLAKPFRNHIEKLNASDQHDLSTYDEMITLFGSHFFQEFEYGGLAKVTFRRLPNADGINTDYLDEVDGFDYRNAFEFGVRKDRLVTEENFAVEESYFIANHVVYEKVITFYGGQLDREKVSDPKLSLPMWANTVQLNPWLLGGVVRPISELIEHPVKRHLMRKAIANYMDKQELVSAKSALETMQQLAIATEELEEQLFAVNRLNENPNATHAQVLNVSRQVQDFIDHKLVDFYRNKTFVTIRSDQSFGVAKANGTDSSSGATMTTTGRFVITFLIAWISLWFYKKFN